MSRGGQRCARNYNKVKRNPASRLLESITARVGVPRDDPFYKEVEEFLRLVHCTPKHAEPALHRFEALKLGRACLGSIPTTLFGDQCPAVDRVSTGLGATGPEIETPQDLNEKSTDTDDEGSVLGASSSPAISPGCKSDLAFSLASPASTAATTPHSELPENGSIPRGLGGR